MMFNQVTTRAIPMGDRFSSAQAMPPSGTLPTRARSIVPSGDSTVLLKIAPMAVANGVESGID
jgi:hypothetical protein